MSFSNPWFWIALISTFMLFKLDLISNLLNLSRLKVPEDHESEDLPMLERAGLYNFLGGKLNALESSIAFGVFLFFWWFGGFPWVQDWVTSWNLPATLEPLAVISLLFLGQSLLHLPFTWYDTFVIEARFGFNQMTQGTFWMDRLKGLFLGALLGLPLLWSVLWIFLNVPFAALYAWLLFASFSLLMSYLAPRWIMPLFYQFKPLEDSPLKAKIFALGQQLQFPVQEVFVIDGSKRSSKANAFFTGFGKNKRIALFDTLMAQHDEQEILAVLAHEIGHYKKKHMLKQMIFSLASMALMFALLQVAIQDPRLAQAFGISSPTLVWSFIAFSLLYTPISTVIGWISSFMSRKYEYEADGYAKAAMGESESLIKGLQRLTDHHLSHPNPHPLYVFLNYSHPTVGQRVSALKKL